MGHPTVGLITAAFILLFAFGTIWRSKSWFGALTGSEPLYFNELPSLLPQGVQIEVLEAPNAERFPHLEVAKRLRGDDISVIYYRSKHPEGIIETMDIWVRGKRGRLLRFENEVCVGWAGIGPRTIFRTPSHDAKRFADIFASRVRALTLGHQARPS